MQMANLGKGDPHTESVSKDRRTADWKIHRDYPIQLTHLDGP